MASIKTYLILGKTKMKDYIEMAEYILEARKNFASLGSIKELTFYNYITLKANELRIIISVDDSYEDVVASILEKMQESGLYHKTIGFVHECYFIVKHYPETNVPTIDDNLTEYYLNILYEAKLSLTGSTDDA